MLIWSIQTSLIIIRPLVHTLNCDRIDKFESHFLQKEHLLKSVMLMAENALREALCCCPASTRQECLCLVLQIFCYSDEMHTYIHHL